MWAPSSDGAGNGPSIPSDRIGRFEHTYPDVEPEHLNYAGAEKDPGCIIMHGRECLRYCDRMFSVGIIGASGYAGAELLRLVAAHPQLKLAWATGDTQAGSPIAELYPSLIGAYGEECFRAYDPNNVDGLDVVMLALPHGKSQELVPDLRGRARTVVDVAADFRLKDASLYPTWYGEAHACPELLAEAVYGACDDPNR